MKRAIGVTALVVLVESLGLLAAVPFSEQTASSDLAQVFIYRYREMFGFANRPSVYCNDIELARIQNGRFFMATLEPGHYSCRSNEREVVAEFDAEAGDVYFLRVQIVERFLGARGRLLPMNPFQAVADLQRLEPLDADQIRDVTRVSTPVAPTSVPEDARAVRPPVEEPTLQDALEASAADLSQGYRLAESYVNTFLPMAEQGGTLETPEGTIDERNVEEYRERYEARLAIYRTAIEQRGYESFAGTYEARATDSCERAGSAWASAVAEGYTRGIEIVQDGFTVQLTTKLEFDRETRSIDLATIAVESVMTFDDPSNSDYSLVQ